MEGFEYLLDKFGELRPGSLRGMAYHLRKGMLSEGGDLSEFVKDIQDHHRDPDNAITCNSNRTLRFIAFLCVMGDYCLHEVDGDAEDSIHFDSQTALHIAKSIDTAEFYNDIEHYGGHLSTLFATEFRGIRGGGLGQLLFENPYNELPI
jgi:hypothetical protein